MLHQNLKQINVKDFLVAENFPKTPSPKPARIHSPDPFLRAGNSVSVLPNQNPQKNSFGKTESALKPRHTARISLRAEPQKEKRPFHFRKNHPRENQKSEEHFFFLGLPSEARQWRGFRGAYDLVSSHHALRAWHISDFGNRCELGTIETPRSIKKNTRLHRRVFHFPRIARGFCIEQIPYRKRERGSEGPARSPGLGVFTCYDADAASSSTPSSSSSSAVSCSLISSIMASSSASPGSSSCM